MGEVIAFGKGVRVRQGQPLWPHERWDRVAVLTAREWPRSVPLTIALAAWMVREERRRDEGEERAEELELPLLGLRPEEAMVTRRLLWEMASLGLITVVAVDEVMEHVRLRVNPAAREWLRRTWQQRVVGLSALRALDGPWRGETGVEVQLADGALAELDVVLWSERGVLWLCCLPDLSLSRAEEAGRLGETLGLDRRALVCLVPPRRAERAKAQRGFGGPVLTLGDLARWGRETGANGREVGDWK